MGAAAAVPKAKTKPCGKCRKNQPDCRFYFCGWRCAAHAPSEAEIRDFSITRYLHLQNLIGERS